MGVDLGCTLTKIAILSPDGEVSLELLAPNERARIAERVADLTPSRLGLTGGGARRLASQLPNSLPNPAHLQEFEAWGLGARRQLRELEAIPDRHLLVSVGTGTSALLLDGNQVTRVGGTALGGGTLLGLARGLGLGSGYEELCALAQRGHRENIDLRIGDIYSGDDAPLHEEMTAASFAKLAGDDSENPPAPADLAAALMVLVGENVGLICSGLASREGVSDIVYAGGSLRENPALSVVLQLVTAAMGHRPSFLPRGEFTGALGALEFVSHSTP